MHAVADMLPSYRTLGQRLPAAKVMLQGSGISAAEFARAVARPHGGEQAEAALDERFVRAFTVSGNAEECRRAAAACADAGVTELALTFPGSRPAADMRCVAEAITSSLPRCGHCANCAPRSCEASPSSAAAIA